MNNTCKFRSKPLLLLLLLLASIFVLAACGEKVDDIAISDSGKPRQQYVQGQDLDLSIGTLTVISGGETTTIPMNAEGVSISGYNKDQLGKQTVTVSYNGKSTTFDVTVVARISVSEHEVDYFVGDVFDTSKGKVKIAKDEGGFTIVGMNDSAVTITGFDTSKAGTVDVQIAYNANGANYQTTFQVKVHDVGELVFTRPAKTAYQSHETELSFQGGYFTVTAADDPLFSKYVDITADMISGFDPSAATAANKKDALKQTLTVSYGGQTFQYEISILYGPITLIKDGAALLKDLDWSQEVTLTDEQGQAAYEAMAAYFKLPSFDKELISDEEIQAIIPAAATYVGKLFLDEAENYSQSFTVNADGNLSFVGSSYEQMGIDQVKLANPLEAFNEYASLLRQIKETYKTMQIRDGVTVADIIKVPPKEEITFYADMFAFLRSLHENMNLIPEDWKVEDLKAYEANITTAVYMIQLNNLVGPQYSYVFDALAKWRTNNDYFDIIYAYYCYVEEDGHQFIRENLWQLLPLPGEMQDWYLTFYNAVVEAKYMGENADAYLRDTATFLYYYGETLRLAEEIKNGDNQMYKDIYAIINGDQYIIDNLVSPAGGLVSHVNGLVDSDQYQALSALYMEILSYYMNHTYDHAAHGAKVEEMFRIFAKLSATETFQFIGSLQYNYMEAGGTYYAMDYSKKAGNTFVAILANYYLENLPESARPIFQQLLLAIENYALYSGDYTKEKALEAFKAGMNEMTSTMAALTAEDRAVAERLLGDCYGRYQQIYNAMMAPKDYTFDQATQDKLNAFIQVLQTYYAIDAYMTENAANQNELRFSSIQLFAAYEKAKSLYNELLALNNEELNTLLNTKRYSFAKGEQTLDLAFCGARNGFTYWMFYGLRFDQKDENGKVIANVPVWNLYHGTQVPGFLLEAADLLLAGFNGTIKNLDKEYVARVAASLRALDPEHFVLLYGIGIPRYLDCMAEFYRTNIADAKNQDLAIAVLDAEFGYMVYHALGHRNQEVEYFQEHFEAARALLEALSDRSIFDEYLKEIYEFYEEFYNSLK
jgi:hypothetical protein